MVDDVVELSGAWVVVVDVVVSVGMVVIEADESVAWPPLIGVPAVLLVVPVVELFDPVVVPVAPIVDPVDPVVVWARTAPGSATAASMAMKVFVMISIRCYAAGGLPTRY